MLGTLEEVVKEIEKLKAEGKVIVSTNGCFDILHKGHVTYLSAAQKLGDVLVVGINSDRSVQKLKGEGRPVNKAEDRAFVLAALKSVDFVFIFDEDTPVEFIQKLRPNIHAKGGDYVAEKLPEYAVIKSVGAEAAIIPFVDGYSTTQTLEGMNSKVVKS
ncbi:MAG: D-glycero-beta-D-manno-heptose 1-phosphate adenylyltransferase [Bdellovibrionota bacterium]